MSWPFCYLKTFASILIDFWAVLKESACGSWLPVAHPEVLIHICFKSKQNKWMENLKHKSVPVIKTSALWLPCTSLGWYLTVTMQSLSLLHRLLHVSMSKPELMWSFFRCDFTGSNCDQPSPDGFYIIEHERASCWSSELLMFVSHALCFMFSCEEII